VGLRITIDGVVACTIDETPASTNTAGGVFAGCFPASDALAISFGLSMFSKSLRVEVRASDANTAVRYNVIYAGS
jgi:hypothetical protein